MNHIFLENLQEHLKAGHIGRRDFLKRAAALGFSLPVISAALAACGGDDDDSSSSSSTEPSGGAEASPTEGDITINQNTTPTTSEGTSEATGTTSEEPTSAPEASGSSGGSLTFSRQVDSDNIDPVTNDGNINIWVLMNIYDQLIRVADNGVDLEPDLAEDWNVSDDGLTYTFNIRSGVKFFDGSDLTMDDIVWSLERARTNEESVWTFTLEPVSQISAADDSTIVITLSQKWAPFLADIAMFNSSVISKAFGEADDSILVDQTMGTGPFQLSEWQKTEKMTLVKNPNYWEDGLPLLDQIILTVTPDGNSQILQLQGSEIDGIIGQGDVPFNRVPDLESGEGLQVIKSTSTWNNFVVLNTRNAPLDDVNFRQALNYATDKESLIQTVLSGNAEISKSFMPKGALFWNPDQEGYPFDLDKAKEAIAASATPDGGMIEFQTLSGNQQQLQLATVITEMWSAINVEVQISQLESGVYSDNYRNNNFEARATGWTNDIIDPDELVSYAILPEQTENYHTGWEDQKAIDLATEARETLDPDKRREDYYEVQKIHMDAAPFVYLYVIPYIDALQTRVQGFFHHPMGHYVFKNMSVES